MGVLPRREVRQIVGVKRERRRRKQSTRGEEGGLKVKGRDRPRGGKSEELVWSEINMTNGREQKVSPQRSPPLAA